MSGLGSLLPLALSVGSEGRERCLRRGIRTSPLSGETEMQLYFCRSPIADRSPDISGLCQTPSPNWATLWSLHLQEIWHCLTEKRHQTQNNTPRCLPSHPASRGTVFSSLFLAKELSLHDDITFPADTYCIPRANARFASRKQLRKVEPDVVVMGRTASRLSPDKAALEQAAQGGCKISLLGDTRH